MINFNFALNWPTKEPDTIQNDIFFKEFKVSKYKNLEIQYTRFQNMYTLFEIDFDFKIWGRDHAGITFEFTLFNYTLILNLYDGRHWNYEENRWMTEEEVKQEFEEWEKSMKKESHE